jgi:hypothetical protein
MLYLKHSNSKKKSLINVYHIGARDNYVPIDYPQSFDEDFEFVFFEAGLDEGLGGIVLSDGRTSCSNFNKFTSLVWSHSNGVTFTDRKCPYSSGVHKFNKKHFDLYVFIRKIASSIKL